MTPDTETTRFPLSASMLLPVPAQGIMRDQNWHFWGGGVVRTQDGTYHLLFARWPREQGFNAWVTHSEIAHATSPNPGGPYTMQGAILSRREKHFWDADNLHNPFPLMVDGKFYLYYTGNHGNGEWWDHRNHQRIGVAVADHPAGPWTRFDRPLLDVTPGRWDHLVCNCPIVTRGGDGRFYMVHKGVSEGPPPFGGKVRMGLAIADHPLGPFVKQNVNFFDAPGAQFPSDDNYIWFHNRQFHAIVKDYGGHFQSRGKEALVLFVSDDCLSWRTVGSDPTLMTFNIQFADGRSVGPLHRLDQPQLVFDDTGRPQVLLLSVKEQHDDQNDASYLVHVPIQPATPEISR